jgi:hypothetical protein
MSVIEIRLHESLPTNKQNELRYRLELADWRAKLRKAQEEGDYERMDELDREFELLGLP